MNRKLLNFHRSPDSDVGGGAPTSSDPVQTADPAQSVGSGEPSDGAGQSTDGGAASSPAVYDNKFFADLESRTENGYKATDEELDAWMKWNEGGRKESEPEAQSDDKPAAVEPGASDDKDGKQGSGDVMSALMKEVGAKTPEEVATKVRELRNVMSQTAQEAQSMREFVEDLAAGVPAAIAHFEKVSGKKFGAQPQAPVQPASATPVDPDLSKYLLDDNALGGVLDPELGRLMNQQLAKMHADMKAEFQPIIESHKQAQERLQLDNARSRVIDDMVSLAERYAEDYGLKGVAVRDEVAEYVRTRVVGPRIAELVETAKLLQEKGLDSLESAHRIRMFDKVKSGSAQAVIDAQRKAQEKILNVKPSVGLGGKGGSGAAYTEAMIDSMVAGKMDIPAEFLDSRGLPIRSKTPDKLYKALVG